jgi:hypothetical protein
MTQDNLSFDLDAAIAAEAATSQDQNIAKKGGTFTLPATGLVRLRLVGYYELGKKEDSFEGKPKVTDEVSLVFELSGPKHPPKVLDDGTKIPQRITVSLNKSMHEKASYYKLFKAMNYKGTAKIMAQLLGEAFLGTIFHKAWKSDPTKASAQLRDPNSGAYTVRPPIVEDAETGESRTVNVDPPLTKLKAFLWNNPSKAMWASIFIDGQYDAVMNEDGTVKYPAKSKNVLQNRIKSAINYEGSPIADLIGAGELGIPADAVAKAAAKAVAAPAADEGDDPLGSF